MRVENARLGVETTTRKGLTARSATKPRSSSSIDQWRTARPERTALEKGQHAGPRTGSSSTALEKGQHAGPRTGSSSKALDRSMELRIFVQRAINSAFIIIGGELDQGPAQVLSANSCAVASRR